jgi:hypothetical protein
VLHAFVPAASALGLALRTAAMGLLLVYSALVGVWLFPPYWTPYALAAVLLVATVTAGRRLARQRSVRRSWLRRCEIGLASVATLVLAGMIAPALQGRAAPQAALDLASPLGPGRYFVTSGGTTEAINAHLMTLGQEERFRPYRGQSYAVDLVGIDRWGLTASGAAAPSDPRAYVIYGADILAPCEGSVVEAVDGIADMTVPQMDREHMTGNHVLLACEEHVVLLAHMAPGSVTVVPGEEVAVGDLLGRVGNSGNSAAPHLHIHVQRAGPVGEPIAGEPLWFTIDGHFLVRNDILTVEP